MKHNPKKSFSVLTNRTRCKYCQSPPCFRRFALEYRDTVDHVGKPYKYTNILCSPPKRGYYRGTTRLNNNVKRPFINAGRELVFMCKCFGTSWSVKETAPL
jgi:hypothetical protein